MTNCIWKQDLELMEELRDYAKTYVLFVRNGGNSGDFVDVLIDKTIAICMKLKSHRDYVKKQTEGIMRTDEEWCELADKILKGEYTPNNRLLDVIERIYVQEF